MRREIRSDDYYGGDVYVQSTHDEDGIPSDSIEITWKAWGGHGQASITVTTDEARALARALVELADACDAADEEFWRRIGPPGNLG